MLEGGRERERERERERAREGASYCTSEASTLQAGYVPPSVMAVPWEALPVSFLKCVIQSVATRFLKKRSGLARSANSSLLFLSRRRGGLGLPSLTVLYKKQQVSL